MKPVLFFTFTLLLSFSFFAQTQESESASKPTLGFSVGSIGFYGDLNDDNYSALSGNPAYSLYFISSITPYLDIRLSFLKGKVRGEERSLLRNVNFETDLTAGGVFVEYNFNHFIPENRTITPFVTAGLEVVSFNPKTDLLAYGEPYNYWSDGSIRNMAENSPNAQNAVIVQRDYAYETDIRDVGYNESDTYEEKTLAIPLGIGASLKLNDQFNFRLQSIMHLTFSDYIDGVTPNSSREFVGGKKGNGNNDHFLVNSVSLTYNFQKVPPASPFSKEGEEIDLLAYGNTEDFDGDGVIDLVDECPNTSRGLDIDSTGCPVDTDGDGIPDYKDEEIYSTNPNRTNHKGVELTDEMIYQKYLKSNDSTLSYAEIIERDFSRGGRKQSAKYRVKVSEHKYGEVPKNMNDLLSLKDLSKIDQKDKTIYMVGNYKNIVDANQRAKSLHRTGFDEAEVLKKGLDGDYVDLSPLEAKIAEKTDQNIETSPEENEDVVVFRVQLGAFKNQPTESNFKSIPNLFVIESGGFFRYMSGSFDNFNQAAKHKIKMIIEGYKGAFVVAYKNGKRVPLRSVGVTPINSDPLLGE